jgi:hypothetical protein
VAVNIEYSPAFCMITIGQTGRLLVSQNYDDTKLLKEMHWIWQAVKVVRSFFSWQSPFCWQIKKRIPGGTRILSY